ncbi:tRNA (guanine(37)-N1)-methyltransferase 1 [Punica granatum]|uniref:tRNA (guanine(37)-N1)-methyltransferase n=1 Tax=Punica granatum TaxID=22663 RepID=A0A6P8EGR4_PUNGR|nr:tRNA (guanine(37)-N1)-methyltransferase 1 [Punica granatum]
MAAKLFLRPHCLSLPILLHARPLLSPLPALRPSLTAAATSARAASSAHTQARIPYGPSLYKGARPHPTDEEQREREEEDEEEEEGKQPFDEQSFTRVFNVAALRVPSKDCFALESRLRGHLLNWPRVHNIARVTGDEVDPDIVKLVGQRNGDEGNLEALERRVYGKAEGDGEELGRVLYREKLTRTFNSQGFANFGNLARITRPKKRKKREDDGNGTRQRDRSIGRNEAAMVEVVEDEGEGDDLRGLLGEGFKRSKWRGSTRLLLLDERYANEGLEDLPEAIEVMFREDTTDAPHPNLELVSCKLTLFYDYWSMNEVLEVLLPKGMIVPSAFETVGHIAHLNLRDEHLPYKKLIAKVVLDKNKPKIRTVVNKIDAIHSDYRTMQLEVLAGNKSLVTTVVENGLKFTVDLATVYWNSRLAMERLRLVSGFTHDDVVCDVFCGVGPITISAAKIVKRVYANDLNPSAIEYLERNSVLNRLERKIKIFNMDGRRFISLIFASEKALSITQVVMNLPNDAAEYLDAFRGIYSNKMRGDVRNLPTIHVYGFSKADDPEFDFHERIRITLREVEVDVEMRRVRLVAPGKWMLCAKFTLPQSVAFARNETLPLDRL